MSINLHIERLVLDGVNIAPSERHILQAKVTSELTQMLSNGGLTGNLVGGDAVPRLSASEIQLTDNKPKQLGQQIAQSVYGEISRE